MVRENCENRNDPDLVQAFLKKWWVESDFKVPNLPLSLRLKGSGVIWYFEPHGKLTPGSIYHMTPAVIKDNKTNRMDKKKIKS
jgi:hypothetical protein